MRIFVGGLPYVTSDEELRALFEAHGQVSSATVVMDRFTGRSRGFGFVEMLNDTEGQKAVRALNGTSLGGRSIAVNEAREPEARGGSGGRGSAEGGGGDRGSYGGRRGYER